MRKSGGESTLKSFYEAYGVRRVYNPLEMDFDQVSAEWKVEKIIGLLPRPEFLSRERGRRLNVAELGCGSGQILRALRDRLPDVRLFGVDMSKSQLRIVKREVPSALFACGDVGSLCSAVAESRLENEYFDAVRDVSPL